MLKDDEVLTLREELSTATNPLYFYDDDQDGLCSFLLLYRHYKEGHGFIVKTAPKLDASFVRRIEERTPDKIFVLDVPIIKQEFADGAKLPIFWIDHHQPIKLNRVRAFNPRIHEPDEYTPVTRLAYQISANEKDLWIATVGCLADAYMPDFIDKFIEKYPYLLDKKVSVGEAMYKYPIGKLVRIFSFLLKGQTSEVSKCVKILTRINSPDEIMQQTTPQGKFLYHHFESMNKKYEELVQSAKKKAGRSKLLLFYYNENKFSFTSDLANELMYLFPKKIILIARNKSGEMKCSLRAGVTISGALEKALVGIQGYGGGHAQACGAVIKEEDWERFLKQFKEEIKSI